MEDFIDAVTGPWGMLALILILPSARKLVKGAAKSALHAGLAASDQVKGIIEEAKAEAARDENAHFTTVGEQSVTRTRRIKSSAREEHLAHQMGR